MMSLYISEISVLIVFISLIFGYAPDYKLYKDISLYSFSLTNEISCSWELINVSNLQ